MTYQEALDTCAADGASLPKLLSADDTLAVKHYVNKNNFANVWTSLLKVNRSIIMCTDNTCDGLVEWAGGPTFAFDASVHVVADNTGISSCFRFSSDTDDLNDGQCGSKEYPVICQFTPITVPSDYELRNGKYYKVLDFMIIF